MVILQLISIYLLAITGEFILKEILLFFSVLASIFGLYKLVSELIKGWVAVAKEKSTGAAALAKQGEQLVKLGEQMTDHSKKIIELEQKSSKMNEIVTEAINRHDQDYRDYMNRLLDMFKLNR